MARTDLLWNPEAEEVFFQHLSLGYGVRRWAGAAGFSAVTVYKRARDQASAARWEEAKAHGCERNDMLLIDCAQWPLDPAAIEAAEDLPKPIIAEAIRIQRLRPRDGGGGRRRARRRQRMASGPGGRRGRLPAVILPRPAVTPAVVIIEFLTTGMVWWGTGEEKRWWLK